ncbi:MAG: FtsX-like permease family protein [Pedosphaera sp.]|nr:FtsX-like permease family protein [Pedosphaera sp.]
MRRTTLILASLRHHTRSHLSTLLGASVASAVLIGALTVGDSVRASLRSMAMARLGNTQLAIASNDRLFRSALAKSMAEGLNTPVTAALQLPATAAHPDGSARANHVQVLGVDDSFWTFHNHAVPSLDTNGVTLNERLATQLGVKAGDTVLFRVQKPSQLSRDAPVAPQEDFSTAIRLTVSAVLPDTGVGRFSLQANQVPPYNAFVPLTLLQQRTQATNKANLLLIAGDKTTVDEARRVLQAKWQLADAELDLRERPATRELEIRTPRVFLDPPVVEAAEKSAPGARLIQTYFVNELRVRTQAVPYSMVTAAGAPIVPVGLRENEIVINQWLADDLKSKPGDTVQMTYYAVGLGRQLEERTNTFTVHSVVPLSGAAADPDLMPAFPGMSTAENCRDWDTGFPIKLDRIRPVDEKYWDDHKGTPKAFISLAAGRKLWANRFGDTTAVRWPTNETATLAKVEAKLLANLDPSAVGLSFVPVRSQALAAVSQAQNFGGLFIGFSFFLVVAALLLMSLLFQFAVEKRTAETGTLLALGFTPRQVRRLLLGEGAGLALLGGLIGAIGGIGYARAMLHGLTTVWRDAVGTTSLQFHWVPTTVVIGAMAGALIAMGTVWLALRKQFERPAREQLAGGGEEPIEGSTSKTSHSWLAIGSLLSAMGLVGWALATGHTAAAGAFFGAGALLLVSVFAFASSWLKKLSRSVPPQLTLYSVAVRNCARRRKRSLATLGLLACGSFLVVAVGANKLDATADAEQRSAGTGGFAFIGESALAVVQDLNDVAGREFFGLDEKKLDGVTVIPMRVRDGDDASCLNLNRAQKPRLLGVKSERMLDRFTFAKVAKGRSAQEGWRLLQPTSADDAVPAIADHNSILWAMGKKVGDTIEFKDERGRVFKVRLVGALANSILQGSLILDEAEFVRRYPGESGYRMFLVDAPPLRAEEVRAELGKQMRDVGMELTPAARKLAEFNAVQNTYLSTFQILGGLGLLLGSAGLGVLVLRNVLDRRSELSALRAIGFRSGSVRRLVFLEHGQLLIAGLLGGTFAAAVSVLPALLSPTTQVPYVSLGVTLSLVVINGLVCAWLATAFALKGNLVAALRSE